MLLTGLATASAEPCEPWPGEPTPLPRVGEADDLRARWALLRVHELSVAATRDEGIAPGRAHRLWQHVRCLDPESAEARAGIARTPLVAVHRPPLVNRAVPGEPEDPIVALAHPLRLWRPAAVRPPPAPPPPPAEGPAFETVLGEAEDHLRAARFEETLERVAVGRGRRNGADPDGAARLEVVGATAALALGRTADAEASLGRALDAKPDLVLDPATTPPKVRRALDRVRATRGSR